MLKKLLIAGLAITLWSTTGQAMSFLNKTPLATTIIEQNNNLHLIGERKFKKNRAQYKAKKQHTRNQGPKNFAAKGRVVKDTCPGGDHGCIKDLKANCDKAGGGLSTEPDGGVDCFVVGIHDQ